MVQQVESLEEPGLLPLGLGESRPALSTALQVLLAVTAGKALAVMLQQPLDLLFTQMHSALVHLSKCPLCPSQQGPDARFAQLQRFGDLPVTVPFGSKQQDLPISRRQPSQCCANPG